MTLRDEADKLMDDFFGRLATHREAYEGDWLPSMDIKEGANDVSATVELPGLNKEDIKVCVQNDILTISGEKHQEKIESDENMHRIERTYGHFKRSVALPMEVDSEKVKASYKDGVLTVTMPKVESKKVKEIPIQIS
jgi:HSP20 family protein